MSQGDTVQPRRVARRVSTRPAVPAAIANAVRVTTRYGDGWAANDHGGWPARPGSAGSITEGPSTAHGEGRRDAERR